MTTSKHNVTDHIFTQWLTYAPVASNAATYYSVPESTITWISTAFFLAFVAVFPISIAILHRGPKLAFMTAAVLILIGNWIRYAGSTSRKGGNVAYAMAGEIVIGFGQPFILAAPTRYSDLWFTNRGRIAATALTSLANPFGAALGQLITPFWVSKPADVSNMVLYVSIIVCSQSEIPTSTHLTNMCVFLVHGLLCPSLLRPRKAAHTCWTLVRNTKAQPSRLSQRPHQISRALADSHPFLRLCRLLQLHLFGIEPDHETLWLHR